MISFIILAAGESKRFLGNKLLYQLKPNETVIQIMVKKVLQSRVDKIVVVLGHEADQIQQEIDEIKENRLETVVNPHYKYGGMSSSVIKGLECVLNTEGTFISPGDIPILPTAIIDAMIDLFFVTKESIIIPSLLGRKGHPILIKSQLYSEVLKINERERGLKGLIQKFQNQIRYLTTNEKGILSDIDTLEDLKRLKSCENYYFE